MFDFIRRLFKGRVRPNVEVTEGSGGSMCLRYERCSSFGDATRILDRPHVSMSWNSRNITENPELIRKVWTDYIKPNDTYRLYFEETCAEGSFVSRKGITFINIPYSGNFFEIGFYESNVRYDINYVKNVREACPEFAEWLSFYGRALHDIYEKDRSL